MIVLFMIVWHKNDVFMIDRNTFTLIERHVS